MPTLELAALLPGAPPPDRARALDALLRATTVEPGFFALRLPESALPAVSVGRAYAESRRFFTELTPDAKARYHASLDARGRGWTSSGEEPSYVPGARSLVECFDLGRELPAGGTNSDPAMGPNVWPRDELATFEPAVRGLYDSLSAVSRCLFVAFAEALGLPPDTFGQHAGENARATMRLLRYPPAPTAAGALPAQPPPPPPLGAQWHARSETDAAGGGGGGGDGPATTGISSHTDFECFTLMHQSAAGLELRPLLRGAPAPGLWVEAPQTPPDVLLVIVGDMLERWTNGTLRATEHRVPATPWERYALVRFNGLASGARVAPLGRFGPARYGAVTQGEHMARVYESLSSGKGAQGTARWGAAGGPAGGAAEPAAPGRASQP